MEKAYEPQKYEDALYSKWEESGFFNPDNLPGERSEAFAVMMPPPNVTGVLHLGHALENSLMDIQVRYQRMNGKKALLVPGTDHAAVATQAKVEDLLKKEGIEHPREEYGREGLLEKIREFAEDSKSTILGQVRKMGTSADWSRLAYTFDKKRSEIVNDLFIRMFNDGLIYRGYRVVNWSVVGQSTASDDEVEHAERNTTLYTFRYSKNFPIPIATVLPETKLGDTAVAVHPEDDRYKQYIGQTFTVDVGAKAPLEIHVIADEEVDPEYGTGALGVTPTHSTTDFEMYQRNKEIGLIQVISADGCITEAGGEAYAGLPVKEAREKFVQWLRDEGLMISEEEITHSVTVSDRFKDEIWPIPMEQWFIDVNKEIPGRGKSLKDLMMDAVTAGLDGDDSKKVTIVPEQFDKVYRNWIENLHDWCISRQIWWGHRIPAYYDMADDDNAAGLLYISTSSKISFFSDENFDSFFNDLEDSSGIQLFWGQVHGKKFISFGTAACLVQSGRVTWSELKADADGLRASINEGVKPSVFKMDDEIPQSCIQDEDTLDTWFSSGMWSFSTLGGEGTDDFNTFHPTGWMQMGHEILRLWMARMIMFSAYAFNDIPFHDVYIHGMLRDKNGEKFSKSKGNGIDPLDVIEEFGTDALRLSLIKGISPGNDSKFFTEKVEDARNFVNKLWNISRFVDMQESKEGSGDSLADKWIRSRVARLTEEVTDDFEQYRFSQAAEKLYMFVWSEFADWYVEVSKVEGANATQATHVLHTVLKLLHPYIPFVTEQIAAEIDMPCDSELLMVTQWPQADASAIDDEAEKRMQTIQELIVGIRGIRSQYRIDPAPYLDVLIEGATDEEIAIIESLARVKHVETAEFETSAKTAAGELHVTLPLDGVINIAEERKRIQDGITELESHITGLEQKLQNENFVQKAPKEVVEETKEIVATRKVELENLQRALELLD